MFTDMLGNEIKEGDQLVWAHNYGRSSARLTRGVVVGFTKQKIQFRDVEAIIEGSNYRRNINPGPSVLIVNNERWGDVMEAVPWL